MFLTKKQTESPLTVRRDDGGIAWVFTEEVEVLDKAPVLQAESAGLKEEEAAAAVVVQEATGNNTCMRTGA